MLQAMNTGHDGSLTTLHANSPEDMIVRLVTMVRYGFDLPVEVIEENIASAIDVAVQTSRSRDGRRFVSAIAEMHRGENSACVADPVFTRRSLESEGVWARAPSWLDDAIDMGLIESEEVASWKRACSLS